MITKRTLIKGLLSATVLAPNMMSNIAFAHHTKKYRRKKKFKLAEKFKPQTVVFSGYKSGTIVVDPKNHFLYLVQSRVHARRYGVGFSQTAGGN